jgi:lipoprotein-anchoring transpeptidase ErfK/SrfK
LSVISINKQVHTRQFVSLSLLFLSSFCSAQNKQVQGISFSGNPAVFIPAKTLSDALGIPATFKPTVNEVSIGSVDIPIVSSLPDGTKLVLLRDLANSGAGLDWDMTTQTGHVTLGGKSVEVRLGLKRVVVDISKQQLNAYQGDYIVFTSHISTGKPGKETPIGQFAAGVKSKLHHSSLYNNAPMPWSVQVNGNVFIHGFKSVPSKPASHGCIRMPVKGARWFYGWVDVGTPVSVEGAWAAPDKKATKKAA